MPEFNTSGPPLNALRAFEAASRLGSFTAAAHELCVTPGAVAQHIKSLEAWAGASLFERRAQGVVLTELGKGVCDQFSQAFDQLFFAVQSLRSQAMPDHIRIAALPSIAQLWLSPRLPEIRAQLPNVTLSVTALEMPPNLQREPFDLCIFFEETQNASSVSVCEDVMFPVCVPEIASHLATPMDLEGIPCLKDANWSDDWSRWLSHVAPNHQINIQGPVFSLYSLAVEEALQGAGVLMAHGALVERHLANGRLIKVFEESVGLDRQLTIRFARTIVEGSRIDAVVKALIGAGLQE